MSDVGSDFRRAVRAVLPGLGDARSVWGRLGRAGLLDGFARPGRQGTDHTRLDGLLTELDARLRPGVVLSVCVQAATVLPLLAEAAADSPYAAKVLDQAVQGDAVVALAVTDSAGSGSDLLHLRTGVRENEGGAVLDGGKDWITNAGHCDHALVLARHRPAHHFTSFRWILVPSDAAGVSCRTATGTLFAGSAVGHLRFDEVRLLPEYLVGVPGRGLAGFARQAGAERLAGALWARALCRRVLTGTLDFLKDRPSQGGSLWDNAAVRERFARLVVEFRRLDAMCAAYGTAAAAAPAPAAEGMVLKAAYAESAERILTECVSLRGADAFRDGGEAALRAEAAMFGIAGGAGGVMLAGIAGHAEELLGTVR
ncbi:acyl-CoA dehydrogenase family protein [Streptomyces sp. NPDC059568]|uniref:acyl-CoA dehydrogenase family protein n=1 Tax=Streptomyces sp. NPDC059568 TaxID=3346868 RepID=UPI00368A6AD2